MVHRPFFAPDLGTSVAGAEATTAPFLPMLALTDRYSFTFRSWELGLEVSVRGFGLGVG